MEKDEFLQITERIGNAHRDPFTEAQFEEWYRHFGKEDYKIVDTACTVMLGEYKYFPLIATLREYIRRIKSSEEEKQEQVKRKALLSDANEAPAWFLGTGRFMEYLRANKINFGHWDIDKLKAEKAKFEKEHPNWKSRSQKPGKMSSICDVLPCVLKTEFEEE